MLMCRNCPHAVNFPGTESLSSSLHARVRIRIFSRFFPTQSSLLYFQRWLGLVAMVIMLEVLLRLPWFCRELRPGH